MNEKTRVAKSKKRFFVVTIISVLITLVSFAVVATCNLRNAEATKESVTSALIGNIYRSKYESDVVTTIDTITFSDNGSVLLERETNFKRSDENDAIRTHVFHYEVKVSALGKITVILIPSDSEPWEPDEIAYDDIGIARIGDSFAIQNRAVSGEVREQSNTVGMLWIAIPTVCFAIVALCAFDYLSKVSGIKRKARDAEKQAAEAEKKRLVEQAVEKEKARADKIKYYWDEFSRTHGLKENEAIRVDNQLMWIANNRVYLSETYTDYIRNYNGQNADPLIARPVQHIIIPIDKIQYFAKEGDIQYTTKISGGGGGGYSIAGAIVGGIIAGDTGAVIGSRKKVNAVVSETETHDSRHTVLRYFKGSSIETMQFEGFSVYEYLLKVIPERDLLTIQLKQTNMPRATNATTIIEKLQTLKTLHEEGLISDSDYEEKKAELLQQL